MRSVSEMRINMLVAIGAFLISLVGGVISYDRSVSAIKEEIAKNLVPRMEIIELIKTHAPLQKVTMEIDSLKESQHTLEMGHMKLQTEINTKLDFIMRDIKSDEDKLKK